MGYYRSWPEYVPVAKRRALAAKATRVMKKQGKTVNPIIIEGRTIAKTFWGKAWCDNLETYSDYDNRLPRGRTYVRNGSVIDLQVTQGHVHAQVMGSSLYEVTIQVKTMPASKWQNLIQACSGKIDSLIELLQGSFSKAVMSILIAPETAFFPSTEEISMCCSCPDYAGMCKHSAAVLYGIGAAIDTQPEWLFTLRSVDHLQLISSVASSALTTPSVSSNSIDESSLSALFDIELETGPAAVQQKVEKASKKKKKAKSKKNTVEVATE